MTMPTAQPVPGTAQQQRQRQQKRPRRKEAPGALPAGRHHRDSPRSASTTWNTPSGEDFAQRVSGVTEEDRRALLGNENGSITIRYSAAELGKLIDEGNKISATDSRGRR